MRAGSRAAAGSTSTITTGSMVDPVLLRDPEGLTAMRAGSMAAAGSAAAFAMMSSMLRSCLGCVCVCVCVREREREREMMMMMIMMMMSSMLRSCSRLPRFAKKYVCVC